MDYQELAKEFKELLKGFKRVSIFMHKRPDGDTIGSALALYKSLKRDNFNCELVCIDRDLPYKFRSLNGFSKIRDKMLYNDSLVVTLDCAELNRTGFDSEIFRGREIVNIDHHISNSKFGTLNIVEPCVSTSALLYQILKNSFYIDKDIASALYLALISDSLNFTTSLVSKRTFKVAMELLDFGVDINLVANIVNRSNSLAHLRAKSRAIDNLDLLFYAKVAITHLSQEDLDASGARDSDLEGVIDEFISLVNVEIAILIIERDGVIKVSIRSKNRDILKIVSFFGGGGHKNAGGFEVKNVKIQDLKQKIIDYIKESYKWEDEDE